MPIPLIGVTTYRSANKSGNPNYGLNQAYSHSLSAAGAAPVLIPLDLPQDSLFTILSRVDGLLFTGGGDIGPQLYGGSRHPQVSGIDPDRDRTELLLYQAARQNDLPFFGICRGLQLVNVAQGGTLYEHIIDQHPDALDHSHNSEHGRDRLAHQLRLTAGSNLERILGQSTLEVNSLHHQGIRKLGAGLRATAYAPDGLIEGIELENHDFGLAVQWHPEELQAHASMRSLFENFVCAAQARRG